MQCNRIQRVSYKIRQTKPMETLDRSWVDLVRLGPWDGRTGTGMDGTGLDRTRGGREMQFLCNLSWVKLGCLFTSPRFLSLYFIALSSIVFWLLNILK
ncbi:hypothetical protein SAY87_029756 [Trapa incisa]|uniref:Uncharacterized protein n=1 Tax=Trapa incisa TaxID=236973 RepID=A0AAN7KDI2_9MYRT|nr:hypothetical protein SAY87_029756 [Trapa incisa]